MSRGYRLARAFVCRVAGAPFEALEALATPVSIAAARAALEAEAALSSAQAHAFAALEGRRDPVLKKVRRALDRLRTLPEEAPGDPALSGYSAALGARDRATAALDDAIAQESASARDAAMRALPWLRRYLVFGSESAARGVESGDGRTIVTYLQRIAAKNETMSEFGPTGWGAFDSGTKGFHAKPGAIVRRNAYLERWVLDAIVTAMNADPRVRAEVPPRPDPFGRIEGVTFVRLDEGRTEPLDEKEIALVGRCDGLTPGWKLGDEERLAALAERGVLRWRVEARLYEPRNAAQLIDFLREWRDGEARRHWLPLLEDLAAKASSFADAAVPARRRQLLSEVRAAIEAIGGSIASEGTRKLYSATNPIGEDCSRELDLRIGDDVTGELLRDATPWFDLWRDTYAYVCSRVNARLRDLHASAPRHAGRLSFAAFATHCRKEGMPIHSGLVRAGRDAFREVQRAFVAQFEGRPSLDEWHIGREECEVVRRGFRFETFDAFTWPSADLQIDARSAEAISRGEYRWVVAEQHMASAIVILGAAWDCPRPDVVGDTLRRMLGGGPLPIPESDNIETSQHTIPLVFPIVGEPAVLVTAKRGHPTWHHVRPADAEVLVTDDGDVRMCTASGADLGSFARSWFIPHAFHPFVFPRQPEFPRLVMGRTVVQRRTWTLAAEELGTPSSRLDGAFVRAVEQLRARRGLPRRIYVRPTDGVLPRSGMKGRDKDVKPIYLDLESLPLLDLFRHWLSKYPELEASEMLPVPGLLRDEHGCYSFEMRTILGPEDV